MVRAYNRLIELECIIFLYFSSFEFDTEFYALYQHNGEQIPNEVRLCEYLDNIANRKYEVCIIN